jgi:hypothetical protein
MALLRVPPALETEASSSNTVLLSPDDTQETPKYKGFLKLTS